MWFSKWTRPARQVKEKLKESRRPEKRQNWWRMWGQIKNKNNKNKSIKSLSKKRNTNKIKRKNMQLWWMKNQSAFLPQSQQCHTDRLEQCDSGLWSSEEEHHVSSAHPHRLRATGRAAEHQYMSNYELLSRAWPECPLTLYFMNWEIK